MNLHDDFWYLDYLIETTQSQNLRWKITTGYGFWCLFDTKSIQVYILLGYICEMKHSHDLIFQN